MISSLSTFLADYRQETEEAVRWDDMHIRVRSYLCAALPPIELITSVRTVLLHDDTVMVIRDPDGTHVLPGGRREADEALADTLTREVLEETGWTIETPQLLGLKHFHHLTAMPPKYAYPYPDFVQLVYWARAQTYLPHARETDGYELETSFMPFAAALQQPVGANDRMWLHAAQQAALAMPGCEMRGT